ncbi:MAG: MBL fold metallo-hydrolase [Candidatus Woesearchaeota archaeon]
MENKIVFLGTSGDVVSAGRYSSAGGFVLQTEGFQFHVDPGVGALESGRVLDVNLRETQVVLCSNNSLVDSGDLNAVIEFLTHDGDDKHGILIAANSVVNGSDSENPILKESTKKNLERIITVRPSDKIGLSDIAVHATKCNAKDGTAIGFKFEAPHFTLSYIPTAGFGNLKQYEDTDILLLSVKNPNSIVDSKELTVKDAIKTIEEIKPRLVIITNLGYMLHKESSIKIIRDIQKETKIQTMVATSGLVVNAGSYKKVKQEKLGL